MSSDAPLYVSGLHCVVVQHTLQRLAGAEETRLHRDLGYKVLWSVVRLLCERLRITNDNLRSFLAMSMFYVQPDTWVTL